MLDDLSARLRATHWPDTPEDADRSLGTDATCLRELAGYRAGGFDWPAQEAALARLPRFRVRLDGLGIRFVHARAVAQAGPVLPLVLGHGWPDSFWRCSKAVPLLTDPGAHGATANVVHVSESRAAGTSHRSRSPRSMRRSRARSSAPTGGGLRRRRRCLRRGHRPVTLPLAETS